MITNQFHLNNPFLNTTLWVAINRKDADCTWSGQAVDRSFLAELFAVFCGGYWDGRWAVTRYSFYSSQTLRHFLFLCEAWGLTRDCPRDTDLSNIPF